MAEYFGPLACWVDREFGLSSIPTGASYPVHTAEDLHLRCSSHMLGYHVWATDGDFGTLEGFVMDRGKLAPGLSRCEKRRLAPESIGARAH